jgi:hypothetical protein
VGNVFACLSKLPITGFNRVGKRHVKLSLMDFKNTASRTMQFVEVPTPLHSVIISLGSSISSAFFTIVHPNLPA